MRKIRRLPIKSSAKSSPGRMVGVGVLALLIAIPAIANPSPEDWQKRVGPEDPGHFPFIQPFKAKFRFGWAGIEAAEAVATLDVEGGIASVHVKGGTTGAARALWRLDAKNETIFRVSGFRPMGLTQVEVYRNRTIKTVCEFREDGLWRLRTRTPRGGKARWRHVRLEPIRDIVSAMFFVRSQRLAPGDKIGVIAYPGDSPFLVELHVLGSESIKAAGKSWDALKIEVRLQKIQVDKKAPPVLASHRKFRRGTVWLSDDTHRFLLKTEVEIFVGKVFAELESVEFNP